MNFNFWITQLGLLLLISCNVHQQRSAQNSSVVQKELVPYEKPVTTITATVQEKLAAIEIGQPELLGMLTGYDGEKVAIAEMDDKPKVIGYWASWCKPCLKEKPIFNKLAAKHPELNFISISIDKELGLAKGYFDSLEKSPESYDYWIGYNPDQPLHWYTIKEIAGSEGTSSLTTIPKYILISEEQEILSNVLPFPSSEDFETTVENLLKSK